MEKHTEKVTKLNQFFATAICGNDILSSALYVSGVAILLAGIYAPLVLLFIVLVLFFYKSVYTEVVEALPVNGGAYNCLLNASSKTFAAIAGVMTILSYIATAVLSGNVGVEYVSNLVHLPIIPTTIGLLFIFALLVVSGIKDSAKVALSIFSFHVIVLFGFIVLGAYHVFTSHTSYFLSNLHSTGALIAQPKSALALVGIVPTIFFAFSSSLLGVSGFESSANFVEEQKKGVFRKTLRNMLIGVAIFNPLIALVILQVLPFSAVAQAKDFLLAVAAQQLGGEVFKILVIVDAFVVLWGAVLTAFVGVSGLAYRMASDGCLPNILTRQNKKGSFPIITFGFFLLCSSILLLTHGNLLSLAGVYTIAFLGVMSSFAFGNLLLRATRRELKRTYSAPILFVLLAFFGTVLGAIGNILIDPINLVYFLIYFIPAVIIVFVLNYEDDVLRLVLKGTHNLFKIHNYVNEKFEDLIHGEFIAFICNTYRLSKILDYIERNETGRNVTLVVCRNGNDKEYDKNFQEIKEIIPQLKKAGAYGNFNIKLKYKNEAFGPKVIDEVSRELKVRKNRILIGSIHHHHPYEYSDLGGVRIIF